MVIPKNLKSDKLLKDRTVKIPNAHVTTPKILVAYIRDTGKFFYYKSNSRFNKRN